MILKFILYFQKNINSDFQENVFELCGRCYAENLDNVFQPIVENLKSHLMGIREADILFSFRMTYFNTSTHRYFENIFDLLDASAERGSSVSIIWYYEEDDEPIEEQGEIFAEDLKHAVFELKEVPA